MQIRTVQRLRAQLKASEDHLEVVERKDMWCFKGFFFFGFFFCVGVNQCWGLKVFSVEVTNVVLKGFSRRGYQCGV